MTQEILDYLLIKKEFLTLSAEELLAKINDEYTLAYYCQAISKALEQDYFFYTNHDLISKLKAIFDEKRFSSKHSKEVVMDLNHILDTIHKYKNMSESEKMRIKSAWRKQEISSRHLPFKYQNISTSALYKFIKEDYYNFDLLLAPYIGKEYNQILLLSTINWLCSNYQEILISEPELLATANAMCALISSQSFGYPRMIKKTEKNLAKFENEKTVDIKKIYKK